MNGALQAEHAIGRDNLASHLLERKSLLSRVGPPTLVSSSQALSPYSSAAEANKRLSVMFLAIAPRAPAETPASFRDSAHLLAVLRANSFTRPAPSANTNKSAIVAINETAIQSGCWPRKRPLRTISPTILVKTLCGGPPFCFFDIARTVKSAKNAPIAS